MSTLPSKFLVVFAVLLFTSQSSTADVLPAVNELVRESCKQTRNYNQCIKALDSGSSYADMAGFTKNLLELTAKHADELYAESNSWRQKTGLDEKMILALETCSNEYGEVIDGLKQAAMAIGSKDYKTANVYAGQAVTAADTCSQEFEESEQKMPFAEKNEALSQLSTVAIDLISHL